MKVITIDSEAYRMLVRKIDRIMEYIKSEEERQANQQPDSAGVWVDNDEAADLLEVSKRTLQRIRSAGEITYSIRGGRVHYTLAEVQRLLTGRVVSSKYVQEADLINAHREYYEKREITPQPVNKRK